MNWRKALARLTPASLKIDAVRGGIPEFTPQEIAGALGFVKNKFGRELICHIYWPDGAALTEKDLQEMLASRMRDEMNRLSREAVIAKLDLHIAEENWAAKINHYECERREIAQLRHRAHATKHAVWPWNAEMHVKIRDAVFSEIRYPNHCDKCQGKGDVENAEGLVLTCTRCEGYGVVAISDRQRADRIGRDESSYRENWKSVYEFAIGQVRDAEIEAGREFGFALSDREQKAA